MQGENNRHSWTKNESRLKVIKYLPNNNKKKENQYVAKTPLSVCNYLIVSSAE